MSLPYLSLDDASLEVRLLSLEPASIWNAPLEAQVYHARLGHAHYEALSYAWGQASASPQKLVVRFRSCASDVEGSSSTVIPIGTNLAEALLHLRKPKDPRVLWIDAVCINQSDDVEKTKQVQLMSKIYREASLVIAWTGPATYASTYFLEVANDVARRYHEIYDTSDAKEFFTWREECSLGFSWGPLFQDWMNGHYKLGVERSRNVLETIFSSLSPRIFSKFSGSTRTKCIQIFGTHMIDQMAPLFNELLNTFNGSDGDRIHEGVKDLWQRVYWHRLWILQELFPLDSPKQPLVVCGLRSIWLIDLFLITDFVSLLQGAVRDIQSYGGNLAKSDVQMRYVSHAYTFLRALPARIGYELPMLVDLISRASKSQPGRQYQICQTSDPRDVVYGLIPFIELEPQIIPDYTKSTRRVYADTSACFLRAGNLTILELAYRRSGAYKLPSWAVDWSTFPRVMASSQLHAPIFSKPTLPLLTTTEMICDSTTQDLRKYISFLGIPVTTITHILPARVHLPRDTRWTLARESMSADERRNEFRKLLHDMRKILPGSSNDDVRNLLNKAGSVVKAIQGSDDLSILLSSIAATSKISTNLDRIVTHVRGNRGSQRAPDSPSADRLFMLLTLPLIIFSNGLCAFQRCTSINVRVGDELICFYGSGMPFIVRKKVGRKTHRLIGPIAVTGIDEDALLSSPNAGMVYTLS